MKDRASERVVKVAAYTTTGILAVVCLYPLLVALAVSFSDDRLVMMNGFRLIPQKLSAQTYGYLFQSIGDRILRAYAMTIFVTAIGTLLAMFVTSMLAYVISQKHVRYRNILSFVAYFTAVFHVGIVPWYVVCVSVLQIKNTIVALIWPYLINVFFLFILKNFFQSIPASIHESARIEGAGDFTIYVRIVAPLAKTSILTIGFLYALQFWNDWWLPIMLVSNPRLFTLQYYLYSMLTNVQAIATSSNLSVSSYIKLPTETIKMAITIVTIGPIVLLYPLVQKYYVSGIIVGGIKG